MGILCDYFAASTDEQAAALIDTGPAIPSGPPAPEAPRRRGLFRRRSEPATAPSGPAGGLPVVQGKGIEPVVQMSTLEALLTGLSVDEVNESSAELQPVAVLNDGERFVMPLTARLVSALAAASDDELRRVAVPWSQTEEFWGAGEPGVLTSFLRELAGLARAATAGHQRVYCWVSV